jgi:hypothetical protein
LSSHVRPPGPRQNNATELLEHVTPNPVVDLRQAYGLARGIARLQPDVGNRAGHRLVWVRLAAFACTTLSASGDAFAVVGRHTQCGIVLPEDPFVALRQLLVRSIALPSGGLALRVLDLHTGAGFVLPDGSRRSSIFAEGPIALAVGEYALVALPTETKGDELPAEMPPPVVDTPAAVREQLKVLALAMSPYRANARPTNGVSRVTLMPLPVMVGEPPPQTVARLAHGGGYALTLTRSGRSATVSLSEEELARGVIIGRSEKCHSETLRRITNENTSRVHVLVLQEGAVTYAYDLASTQGTYLNRAPVRRVALADGGTSLTLGRGGDAVRMVWHLRT